MKIVVCFKIVPDYEEVLERDWDHVDTLDTSYVKKQYGCFDEAALETALSLKDQRAAAGLATECIALTAGAGGDVLLRGLYAAGFDKVTRIGVDGTEVCTTRGTALLLSVYLKKEQPDLILTGRQAGGADSGRLPALLARELALPWICEVTALHGEEGTADSLEAITPALLAECENDNRVFLQRLALPAVLSIGNAKRGRLRMFSLKARMEAKKKPIFEEIGKTISMEEPPFVLMHEKQERFCQMYGGNATRQAEEILNLLAGRGEQS